MLIGLNVSSDFTPIFILKFHSASFIMNLNTAWAELHIYKYLKKNEAFQYNILLSLLGLFDKLKPNRSWIIKEIKYNLLM